MADSSSSTLPSTPVTVPAASLSADARRIRKQFHNIVAKISAAHTRMTAGEKPGIRSRMNFDPANKAYQICLRWQRRVWAKSRASRAHRDTYLRFYAETFTGIVTYANVDEYVAKMRKFKCLSFTEQEMPALESLGDGDVADDESIMDEDIMVSPEIRQDEDAALRVEAANTISHQNLVRNDVNNLVGQVSTTFEDSLRQVLGVLNRPVDEAHLSTIERIATQLHMPLEHSEDGFVLRVTSAARIDAQNLARVQAHMAELRANEERQRLDGMEATLRASRAQRITFRADLVAHKYGPPSQLVMADADQMVWDASEALRKFLIENGRPVSGNL